MRNVYVFIAYLIDTEMSFYYFKPKTEYRAQQADTKKADNQFKYKTLTGSTTARQNLKFKL